MAWPPTIPPATRTNATPQLANHISDHNLTSLALTELTDRLKRFVWGSQSLTTDAAGDMALVFPAPFTAAPIVFGMLSTTNGNYLVVSNRTTTGCTFRLYGNTGVAGPGLSRTVMWLAIGTPA